MFVIHSRLKKGAKTNVIFSVVSFSLFPDITFQRKFKVIKMYIIKNYFFSCHYKAYDSKYWH